MARRSRQYDGTTPLALTLAASGRAAPIDYYDDQVWELNLGAPGSPALALATQYGGRVGLVSLQPTWWVDGRAIYEPGHYASPPIVTAIAPGYLQTEARLTPDLRLIAAYYALDSHAVGMRFALKNGGPARRVRLDLIAFVGSDGVERAPAALRDPAGEAGGLLLGKFPTIEPVVVLHGGAPDENGRKLSALTLLAADGLGEWRAVAAALDTVRASRAHAVSLLSGVWSKPATGGKAAAALPQIETGDPALDALFAFSIHTAQNSVTRLRESSLPAPALIVRRQPDAGFRPHARRVPGSSGSMARGEPGALRVTGDELTPHHAYPLALALASIDPQAAQGVLLNFLASARPDGWIDWSPGPTGTRRGWLCLPILARLAWSLHQVHDDTAFLTGVYDGLARFFERWFAADLDADGDGFPEWTHERQPGYPFLPIFSRGLTVGQNADLRYIESPDLPAYLLSEAISLREIAGAIGVPEPRTLDERIRQIRAHLDSLWRADLGRFAHRDRDVPSSPPRTLVSDRPANETIALDAIAPAARVLIEVIGGTTRPNTLRLHLQGINQDGKAVSETAEGDLLAWTAGRGVYTTQHAYSRIDSLRTEGVIALYRVNVRTVSTDHLDITALIPAWAVAIDPAQAAMTLALLKDPAHFWRKHGVTMLSAQDAQYASDEHEFAAGVWGFWNTLMGEALIEAGDFSSAADLLRRMLDGMTPVVRRERAFYEGYHAERHAGIGVRGHAAGIAPLHLFFRVIGVRFIAANRVMAGGPYPWDQPVTVTQYDVTVRRSAEGTTVTFPGGAIVTLPPDAPLTAVMPPETGA